MGLFNQEQTAPEPPKHKFLSGNIDGLMSELGTEKQNTGVIEDEGFEDFEQPEITDDPDDQYQSVKMGKRVANVAGESMALMIDAVIPILLALLLKADVDDLRCSEDEKRLLIQASADYAQLEGLSMPPWLVFAGTVFSIYGFKVYQGIQANREQKEAAEANVIESNTDSNQGA